MAIKRVPKLAKGSKVKKDKAPVDNDELFDLLADRIDDAIEACTTWSNNQEKWHRMRMRIKGSKTFPFIGCANLRMPTIETKLRKLKSNLVKVILGQRPVVQAIPSPDGNLEVAMKIEKFLDHLLMDCINVKPKAIISIDQTIEKGFYLLKSHWRTEIITRVEKFNIDELSVDEALALFNPQTPIELIKKEIIDRYEVDMKEKVAGDNEAAIEKAIKEIRSGKEQVDIELKDIVYDYPDVALANPEFTYVPGDSLWNPQDCRIITHEFFMPYDTVKRNVQLKGWSQSAIEDIDYQKTLPTDNMTEAQKDLREGVDRLNNPSQLVRIWECYTYYDINRDGYQEKCVITFAPDFGVTLRKITLPFDNGKFPFVKIVNELTDDRWYSHRGMPELIEDLVKEIDTQHNQKLDGSTWRNTPMISYRAGVVNPNLIKLMPGQAIPRHDADDIQMMQNTNLNADFSYEKEQMILETKIEELIGQMDFSLQSMINKRQPRTAFEVGQQQNNMAMVFSLDADIYTEAFSELFSMVWDLWCQYGGDQEEFAYFGENGWEKIKLTREEIQGKYKIVVRGNDQNYNPQVRQQNAGMIMQAITNPIALQTGVVQPVNLYNGMKEFFQTLGKNNWQDFITDPSKLPQQTPPPPNPEVKMEMQDLTPAEQMQVKAMKGIQPDLPGMMLQKQEEVDDSQYSKRMEMIKNAPQPEEPDPDTQY